MVPPRFFERRMEVMLMGDYEMLMVVIATIGLAMAACKGEVSKGVFPAVQGMAEFLFLMSLYLKSPHFQVCARFRA